MYGFAKFFPTVIFALMLCLLSSPVLADDNCYYKGSYLNCYDANGNKTSERYCSSLDSNGNCISYSYGYDYTYDDKGQLTAKRFCNSLNNSKCNSYSYGHDFTYDDNGNKMSYRGCDIVDQTTGKCSSYVSITTYNERGGEQNYYERDNSTLDECTGTVLKRKRGSTGPELICLEAGGRLTCPGDFLAKNGRCIDKSLGCGEGYVEHDNRCEKESDMEEMKLRYTPSEADELTSNDNENMIEWIFE